MEYRKIETLFERREDFTVDETKIKNPIYDIIKYWECTEKIHGQNQRIILNEDNTIEFKGRTDSAQLNGNLVSYLINTFAKEKMLSIVKPEDIENRNYKIILYGESYGSGIQSCGELYNKEKSFRLFDVLVDRFWLDWNDVVDVANKLKIKTVPYLGTMNLEKIVDLCKCGFKSFVAQEETGMDLIAEGIVGKPISTLFDKRLNRVILKLKHCDFIKKEKNKKE